MLTDETLAVMMCGFHPLASVLKGLTSDELQGFQACASLNTTLTIGSACDMRADIKTGNAEPTLDFGSIFNVFVNSEKDKNGFAGSRTKAL